MFAIKVFTFNPIGENTYILYNESNEGLVIDPGCYSDEEKEELYRFITSKSLTIKGLLNTHCHLDHVFGNKFVSETWGVDLQLHEKEEKMLQRAPASGLMFNLPFDNYAGKLIFLAEGDRIALGNDILEVIFTPGHSPGHICFYCREQEFIISGDVLFHQSIGRTDLPGGDHDTLVNSIRKKIFLLPDYVKVYSGHGIETTVGEEIKYNPYVGNI